MFSIGIDHDPTYTAISSTEESFKNERGSETFFFETPLLSPSSIAFYVSGFERKEKYSRGILNVVSARATEMDHAQKLIEKTDEILDSVESFLNIKLPNSVLNSVALPNFDYDMAAFYGFIYYRFV